MRNIAVVGMGLALGSAGSWAWCSGSAACRSGVEPQGEVRRHERDTQTLAPASFSSFGGGGAARPPWRAARPAGRRSGGNDASARHVPAMLIDLSRCVGCGNCQRSCTEANNLQPTTEQTEQAEQRRPSPSWSSVDLEGGKTRWVKRQCMHCLDAACASACPVSALLPDARKARWPTGQIAAWAAATAW